jgi:hypothetical protein
VLDADWLALEPVPGGWVAMDNRGTLFRVGPDTSLSRLDVGRDRVASRTGDAFLTLDGKAMLYRDGELHRARVPAGKVVAGWVTPTGSLVLLRADHGLVLTIGAPERGWVNKRLAVGNAVSGVLAAHDGRAAVVGFGDGADGSLPFAGAWVGGTLVQEVGGWHGVDAPGRLQGHDPSSVAMSDQGTAYVALGDAGTLRIAADGRTTLTRVTDHDVLVTNVGSRVCVLSTAGRGPMRCTGDDGATWTEQPLPGFE